MRTASATLLVVALAGCGGSQPTGTTVDAAPSPASSSDERVVELSAGDFHTCARTDRGRVLCWGRVITASLPGESVYSARAIALERPATALAAGIFHTCALLEGSRVGCFGFMTRDNVDFEGHVVVPAPGAVEALAMGQLHGCALLEAGHVRCWGARSRRARPPVDPPEYTNLDAAEPIDLGQPARAISTGSDHACAVLADGSVRCWGENALLEGIDRQKAYQPHAVPLPVATVALAVGDHHACALSSEGDVRCWGWPDGGRLGVTSSEQKLAPTAPLPLGGRAVAIAVGGASSCAILESGRLRCWGAYAENDPTLLAPTSHRWDIDMGERVEQVVLGDSHVCALLVSGAVRCWGDGSNGRLGRGEPAARVGFPADGEDVRGLPIPRDAVREPAPADERPPCDRLVRDTPRTPHLEPPCNEHLCKGFGLCTVVDGSCAAGADTDCRDAGICRQAGLCAAHEGRCVAGGDAHCRESSTCVFHGNCTEHHGACQACTPEECRTSEGCHADGQCSLRLSRSGALRCWATSAADCAASTGCKEGGRCKLEDGRCVDPDWQRYD